MKKQMVMMMMEARMKRTWNWISYYQANLFNSFFTAKQFPCGAIATYESFLLLALHNQPSNKFRSKLPPNSISEHYFFKISWGGACPQTPLDSSCFAFRCCMELLLVFHSIYPEYTFLLFYNSSTGSKCSISQEV